MDGTTATTLAPSEDEMQKIADVFARMRDTVIDASKLAQEVSELRNSVGALRNELEGLRSTNRWMDTQITELRQQRDKALELNNIQAADIVNIRNDRDSLQIHCDNQRETLARLNEQVTILRKERDEAEFTAALRAEERDEVQKKLDTIVGLVCPKVEPVKSMDPKDYPGYIPEQPRDPETQQFKSWDEPNF